MKKFLVTTIMFVVFGVGLPLSVEAHNGCSRHRKVRSSYTSRTYYRRNRGYSRSAYYRNAYYRNGYAYAPRTYVSRRPSFYRRHRNVINMAIGTGAGALLGGLIGGGRGAGIGALVGLGGSALYTYKLNPKKRRYYRRY